YEPRACRRRAAPRRRKRRARESSCAASGRTSGSRYRRSEGPGSESGLVGLLLRNQATHPLGQQGAVERLLEGIVEPERVKLLAGLVVGQGNQDRRLVVLAFAQVLCDLSRLDPADGQVDDDAVGVEALGADARLESRSGRLDPEIIPL